MISYAFQERFEFSNSNRSGDTEAIIMNVLDGCQSVERASIEQDKTGVDYWATLRGNARVAIDLKVREVGCSQYWRKSTDQPWISEPELALETWSVLPYGKSLGRVGWTLDESKATDYTLHLFDPSDSTTVFLLPFQLLRTAFRRNVSDWKQTYKLAAQNSGAWWSECVFVPADVVIQAINSVMKSDSNV